MNRPLLSAGFSSGRRSTVGERPLRTRADKGGRASPHAGGAPDRQAEEGIRDIPRPSAQSALQSVRTETARCQPAYRKYLMSQGSSGLLADTPDLPTFWLESAPCPAVSGPVRGGGSCFGHWRGDFGLSEHHEESKTGSPGTSRKRGARCAGRRSLEIPEHPERGGSDCSPPFLSAERRCHHECSRGLFRTSTCGSGRQSWAPLSGPYCWFHGVDVPAAGDTVRLYRMMSG